MEYPHLYIGGEWVPPRDGGMLASVSRSLRVIAMRLRGKSVVITAAASGMGRAGVELFLREGARVAAVDINRAGLAETPMKSGFTSRSGNPVEAEANEARLLANVPMGRLCRAEEAAHAALWLASDDASFVTGVALPVDGGFTAR